MDDTSHVNQMLYQAACFKSNAAEAEERAALQALRPFMLLRPKMYPDGNSWCALYGEDIQSGVAGFGDTPDLAAMAFDLEWLNGRTRR